VSAAGDILRELLGLFVDDGALALALVAVVVAAAIVATIVPYPLAAGLVLLVGCLAVLIGNVLAAGRR
jgi:hypothetical protein